MILILIITELLVLLQPLLLVLLFKNAYIRNKAEICDE